MVKKSHDDDRKIDQLKAAQEFMRAALPFYIEADWNGCYAHKFYAWQKDFLLSRKLLNFITAANQVGKSTINLIRCLNQAMRPELWPFYFPNRRPTTFVYCYPESRQGTVEFKEKWVKEYLPKNGMENDARWGWDAHYSDKGYIDSVVFRTGVTVYFRFYSQAPSALQGATVDAVFLDEETPQAHYDELMVRTQARQAIGSGYVTMVFTATIGQEYLFLAMERQGQPEELFKDAFKRQISAFDCMFHADGSPSKIWTRHFIEQELIPKYRNEREILRRVQGRFVKDTALLFAEFQRFQNTEKAGETDVTGWRTFVGIDYGAGGDCGHSSAIVVVKVNRDYSEGRVVQVWHSRKQRMTQSDLLVRYKLMCPEIGQHTCFADWAAVDLFTLAARQNVAMHKAEKSHDIGIPLLNSLFGDRQLKICLGTADAEQLCAELTSLSEDQPKRKRTDDTADALRYAVSLIPWRLKRLTTAVTAQEIKTSEMNPRMAFYKGRDREKEKDHVDYDFEQLLSEAIELFEETI